ncbi:MAG: protein kinase [Ktedonobacteraceae bacterium]|nr:protein kinase [Ktedonobacteraceae bacterium]
MAITRGQHLIGKVLGSCVLERLLGYGGSSAVFLAQQQTPQRKVAVKVFLPRVGMDSQAQRDFYQRFLREAKAASELEHANILPIYSYGEQDGLPYIIMPYMPGGTLADYIAKRGPLSLQETQWYLEQLADALDYAHDQGCIHCDVKPANILLDSEGCPMLSDFGIARLTRGENNSVELKSRDALVGTPDFISPEQALGRPLDGRSDIYSLGVTLFFLLTKRLPFRADSAITLALLHVHEPPPSLALIRADVTEDMDETLKKTLAKNPDDRFQSAGELSAAFTSAMNSSQGKQALLRSRHEHMFCEGKDLSSNSRARLVTHKPQVRAKLLWMHNRRLVRLLLIGIACIIIVSTLGLTTTYIASRTYVPGTSQKPARTATSLVKATKSVPDRLASTNSWPSSSTFFYDEQHQSYHVINKLPVGVALAPYYNHQFQDFRLSITALEVQKSSEGTDYYGIVFRAASDQSHYYLFEIAPSDHAQYLFWRFDNSRWKHIKSGNIPSLATQAGKSNTLTIEARRNVFSFLVNGKAVDTPATDVNAFPLQSGQVGLYVENKGTEVAFSRLYIDSLK